MRIIGGKFKGRKLADIKKSDNLRPTTDSNRENLFNLIESSKYLDFFDLKNANLLDCFCGTGAVSFEAISRGAKLAYLIDKNRHNLLLAKKNCQILGLENQVKLKNLDISKAKIDFGVEFDLIYLDPPYFEGLIDKTLKNLTEIISKNSLIILEYHQTSQPQINDQFECILSKKYGEIIFDFYRLNAP
ncbi:MAG TPA: 16S rRNA (guanine(966)-N(2))-methyltransferase RsmD [Rhodobacter sp.]|nr:16S rRNA (guanine(966)-N(2))-methyltransferase RsmD [Rhodobacter sp.]